MGVMEATKDVDGFLRSLKATKPPWECPKCGKIYKSYSGIEYHMLKFDHDNATPSTPNQKPGLFHSNKKGPKSRKKNRPGNISTPRRSPSPIGFSSPARDTLTWAEAQRMVEVESEGKFYRLDINEKLDIISDSDVDKDDESSASSNSESIADQKSKPVGKSNIDQEEGPVKQASKTKGSGKITNINSKDLKNVSLAIERDSVDKKQSSTSQLPIASFRMISDNEYEPEDAPERKTAYYRYIERPLDELAEEVEYDMDEEDSVWLEIMNDRRKESDVQPVMPDQFELLMDRFEKESYFEQSQNGGHHHGINQMIDEDAVCCVCNDGECQNSNVILFCDMCNLAVHQECYGVPYIPEGQWLCRRCLQSPSCPVDCVLCPNRGGAFKQTDDGRWAHVVCALWVPEVTFANTVFLEPIDGLKRIPPARWRLSCYICKQRHLGACIQCHRANCYTAFHVTCAQQAGLYMKMEPVRETGKNGVTITVKKAAFCDVHRPADASPTKPLQNSYQFEEMDKRALSDSKEKMKKARKILAEKRQEMPHIAIPYIPRDKMSEISKMVTMPKRAEFMQRLLSFWTLKRQSRNGVPLLRRLQSSMQSHRSTDSRSGEREGNEVLAQLKYWQRLRHDLERARLLIELIRKREKMKRELLKTSQAMTELRLSPWLKHLLSALERLRAIDTLNVFANPVNLKDAPEYDKIIKKPMDFSTIEKKIRNYEYKSVDEFETDVNLIVANCMTYNTKDTIFYRLAVKLRDQGGTIIRNTKRDAERIGFDPVTGLLLDGAPAYVEESPGKMFGEIDRLIDGHPRDDLSLENQLKNLFEKLDFMTSQKNSAGKSYKTKKLKTEIKKVRRKLSVSKKNDDAEEDTAIAKDPKPGVSKLMKKKVCRTSGAPNNKVTSKPPHSLLRSLSSPSRPKKKKILRKRLWSNVSEATSDADSIHNSQKASPPPKMLKQSASVERPSTENDSPNEFHKESVSRRSSVLFNKKKKMNSNPVSRQNSNDSNSKANSDNHAFSDSAINNSVFPDAKASKGKLSRRNNRKTRSSDSNDSSDFNEKVTKSHKKFVLNGYLSSPAYKNTRSGSFSRYRDVLCRRRTSSDTDTTSSSSSNENRKSNMKKKKSNKIASFMSRRSSCSAVEARRRMHKRDHSPSSSNCDSDDIKSNPAVPRKRRRTTGSSSTEEDGDSCDLAPLDLVWAKCRGYPSYPALIIDPNMPRSGYQHNGVPIPVPPHDVLRAVEDRPKTTRLYLVLFFDNKRTWQWLPSSKLKPLGLDEKSDQLKLYEGKRPGIRRSVTQAYHRAIIHQSKVSGIIPESDDDANNGNFAEEEDSSDSTN